jgi:hypothetical protein
LLELGPPCREGAGKIGEQADLHDVSGCTTAWSREAVSQVGLFRVRCKITLARLRTRPGGASPLRCEAPSEFAELRCTRWWQTSLTCRATRSQADSLLSIARLNNARSRLQPSARNRPRIIQTSCGLNARFCPTLRPLFHAKPDLIMPPPHF